MARFTPGPMVGAVSGSIGGNTFTRNKYGAMIRRRAVPVDPRKKDQLLRRMDLETIARTWQTLDEAERESWNTYTATFATIDALGQQMELSGLSAYVQTNFRLKLSEKPLRALPPTDPVWYDGSTLDPPRPSIPWDPPYFNAGAANIGTINGSPQNNWWLTWRVGNPPDNDWNIFPPNGEEFSDYELLLYAGPPAKPGRAPSFSNLRFLYTVQGGVGWSHLSDVLIPDPRIVDRIGWAPALPNLDPALEGYRMPMRWELLHVPSGAIVTSAQDFVNMEWF